MLSLPSSEGEVVEDCNINATDPRIIPNDHAEPRLSEATAGTPSQPTWWFGMLWYGICCASKIPHIALARRRISELALASMMSLAQRFLLQQIRACP